MTSIDCEGSGARTVHCADGTSIPVDAVLCNADVGTALTLVQHPRAPSKAHAVADKAYSASVIEYRWNVNRCASSLLAWVNSCGGALGMTHV